MRILWITNVELPEIATAKGRTTFIGGWLEYTSQLLKNHHELHICSMSNIEYNETFLNHIFYSSFKEGNKKRLEEIISLVNPDIIHIWGSEYGHSLDCIRIAKQKGMLNKSIVSIQGLVSYISKYHYSAFLPEKYFGKATLIERIMKKTNHDRKRQMLERGNKEIECLSLANNCIGRTDWDYACVKLINPNINYYYCNEILRKDFYQNMWQYDKCVKKTIFFSQATTPFKGFHILLEALAMIKKQFPEVIVNVTGDISNKMDVIKGGGYLQYLSDLIDKLNLNGSVNWIGKLSEQEMINQYLNCNVFVCSSSIENSSNSISEAMILGVPIVASDVGGIKSMMIHDKEGLLYQADAPYMLANNIMKIFNDSKYSIMLGKNARTRALCDHDVNDNMYRLLNIYKELNHEKE